MNEASPVPGSLIPPLSELTLAQRVVRAVALLMLAVAMGWVVRRLSFLLTPLALGFVGYYCLLPLVNELESRRVPRWAAVFLCFIACAAVVVGLGFAVWPSLEDWLQQMPEAGQKNAFELQLEARLSAWAAAGAKMYPRFDWHSTFDGIRHVLDAQRRQLMETLPTLALQVLSNAGTFLLAPIVTLFLLIDGAAMHRRLISWVPNRYFETVLVLLHRVDQQIAGYLRGAASESATVAALLSIILLTVGMPHAVLFGCLYGLLNVIPLVGPVIGAGSGILYAMMDPQAPSLAVLIACYGATYVTDAMLINPAIVGKNLNLHPLTIILGVSIGGALGGIVGMLVSIPLIAVSKAIVFTIAESLRRHRVI